MTNQIAIKVENLSKCYHIYDQPRDRLKQMILPRLQRMLGMSPKQYYREFWALKDVSFEVKKGETVGIVGCNGSGKSTLLQMICGTLNPASGSIQTNGRIAALLELGSGFNPEFTGRENVYLNGAVLGLGKEEIDAKFDEIAAFADIGDFIEQPVKTYSSGMMLRLAFAVAINVEPEILVIDEALSVGDELFQRKCFSRIEDIRANGATILFVSHSGAQIVELCDHAVLMDAGEKLTVGLPKQVVGRYQRLIYAPADKRNVIRNEIRQISEQFQPGINSLEDILHENQRALERAQELQESLDPNLKSAAIEYVSHGAYIESPAILTLGGKQVNNLIRGKTYRYTYTVRFTEHAGNVRFGMLIKTVAGFELGGATSGKNNTERLAAVEKGDTVLVEYRFVCLLGSGMYFLNAGVSGTINEEDKHLHRVVDALCFRVMDDDSQYSTGIVDFSCTPEIIFN